MTIKVDEHGLTVQAARPALSQTVAVGAASTASAAFSIGPTDQYANDGTPVNSPNNTNHVRLISNTNCWVAFGAAPVAVAQATPSIYLPANTPEYFWVLPGEKIAVIQDSASGFLNIGELVN